jgi:hypothetical protein
MSGNSVGWSSALEVVDPQRQTTSANFNMRLPLTNYLTATERPKQAAEGTSQKSLNLIFDEEEEIQRRIVSRHVESNLDTCRRLVTAVSKPSLQRCAHVPGYPVNLRAVDEHLW